ncbi:hypothetical protein L6E12_28485 [Actinokineospora sp. PR83]|uniref:hypothetical protein n=1 Tax=Actinokineospora sp. PR83 TaxID=2884908 RepID=UPI001F28232A|nr:hypothetical protein [Actinokineospora sp. PR83]MCG8919719.1 hypothetical protein [Actinokineospora sp. PR83]
MKLYADNPTRRTRQAVGDLVALLLVLLATWLAKEVRERILELRGPGDGLITAGGNLRDTFDQAASHADDVPLVGDQLAGALKTGSGAGDKLTAAGQWQIEAVQDLALWVTIALIAVPIAFLLIVWFPRRYRYVREATAATRLRAAGTEGHDLLALRALVTTSLPRLAKTKGIATGWRTGDPEAIDTLARHELHRLGLDL